MLFPKNVRKIMSKEHSKFIARYEKMLDKQKEIMFERGKDRDNESPIFFRRSPEMNLGVAQSKVWRIESLLTQLDVKKPATALLKKIIEEVLDAANYLLFIAVLCDIVLDEEQVEVEEAPTLGSMTEAESNARKLQKYLDLGYSYKGAAVKYEEERQKRQQEEEEVLRGPFGGISQKSVIPGSHAAMLRLSEQGVSNQDIAIRLGKSIDLVNRIVGRIFIKKEDL